MRGGFNVGLHRHISRFIFHHGLFQLYALLIPSIHATWSWRSMKNQFSAARTADGTLVGSYSESIVTITLKIGDNFTCATHFYLVPRQHFFIAINLAIFKDIAISLILFWVVPTYQSVVINFALNFIDLWHIHTWKKYKTENSIKLLFQNLHFFTSVKMTYWQKLKDFSVVQELSISIIRCISKRIIPANTTTWMDSEDRLNEAKRTQKDQYWCHDSPYVRCLQ